jgi:hypothetical protein
MKHVVGIYLRNFGLMQPDYMALYLFIVNALRALDPTQLRRKLLIYRRMLSM